jgi:hypothetical protein
MLHYFVGLLVGVLSDRHSPDPLFLQAPLHKAAAEGDVETVRELLRGGADAAAIDSSRQTPLHWCTSAKVAEALLEAGCDREARDRDGMLAGVLSHTYFKGKRGRGMRLFRALQRTVLELNRLQRGYGHRLARSQLRMVGTVPGVDWLKTEWRYRGSRARPLDGAFQRCAVLAFKGPAAVVRGADFIQFGCSPLIAAASTGDVDGIRDLLRYGADPRALSPCGLTAISIAALQGDTMLAPFLDALAPASCAHAIAQDAQPLVLAAAIGDVAVVAALLAAGAPPSGVAANRIPPYNALDAATTFCHAEVILQLRRRMMSKHTAFGKYRSLKIRIGPGDGVTAGPGPPSGRGGGAAAAAAKPHAEHHPPSTVATVVRRIDDENLSLVDSSSRAEKKSKRGLLVAASPGSARLAARTLPGRTGTVAASPAAAAAAIADRRLDKLSSSHVGATPPVPSGAGMLSTPFVQSRPAIITVTRQVHARVRGACMSVCVRACVCAWRMIRNVLAVI